MEVLVFRDPRESARKCSLTPLRELPDVRFVHDRPGLELEVGRRLVLRPDAPELRPEDREEVDGLLLVDCSWRRLPGMLARVRGELLPRSLPPLRSAYPRRSKLGTDPERGLASIEALHAALVLLGEPRVDLLAAYRWREQFLALNHERLAAPRPARAR